MAHQFDSSLYGIILYRSSKQAISQLSTESQHQHGENCRQTTPQQHHSPCRRDQCPKSQTEDFIPYNLAPTSPKNESNHDWQK